MSNTPVRLHKQEEVNPMFLDIDKRIESFVMRFAPIIMVICMVLLMALFIALCFALMGNGTMESGTQYNHLQNII